MSQEDRITNQGFIADFLSGAGLTTKSVHHLSKRNFYSERIVVT